MKVCIIPARGGSTRIPRKNIRQFLGKPIICYSISNAQRVCDRVIVSTEDPEIAQIAIDNGAEVHQRSFAMARDEVGTQEVAKYVLDELKIVRTARVLLLYPCAPLLAPIDIEAAISGKGYAVAVGVSPLRDAGAMYAGRCGDFRDAIPLYSGMPQLVVLPEWRVCDVNTEEDWLICEEKFKAMSQNVGEIARVGTQPPRIASPLTPEEVAKRFGGFIENGTMVIP